ncbi:MAG: porin family protein [Alistipes sp.]|nr:porin family protein [Alistipes sp.]
MKKTVAILILALTALTATAQNGRSYVGAGINFGTDIETVGIGVKYGYGLLTHLYVEPNFNYFIKDDVNMYDINLDFKYFINVGQNFHIYPIVGLSFAHYKYSYNSTLVSQEWKTNKMGGNFGAGAGYDITSNWFVNIDLKYRAMADIGQGVFSFGFGYRF